METNTIDHELIEELRAKWHDLSGAERGRMLRKLVNAGWKKRELARELGCCESRIRQLTDAAEVREQNRAIGYKKAVKLAAQERQSRRQQALAVAPDQRAKVGEEWLREYMCWLREFVAACDRPMVMDEIRKGPYSIRKEQFAKAAPKPDEIRPGANPQQIISDCRPEGEDFSGTLDWIESPIEWFARWGPRVMYDKSLREEVLAEAERMAMPTPKRTPAKMRLEPPSPKAKVRPATTMATRDRPRAMVEVNACCNTLTAFSQGEPPTA